MTPPRSTLHHGDCLAVMPTLPESSVDAIVTDPPYGLKFMGRDWDHGIPGSAFWAEALRIAKPGCHLLAFGGTRTYHRLACAIEDAGWQLRDTIMWVYGSGFPKSHNVSKAIDKAAGAERKIVGRHTDRRATAKQDIRGGRFIGGVNSGIDCSAITAPATPAAEQWDGWGTALKPAWEPITLARKPLDGTVVNNVLAHGTGALNIDGCRVDGKAQMGAGATGFGTRHDGYVRGTGRRYQTRGRWPANVIHDGSDEVVDLFPESKGQLVSTTGFEPSAPGYSGGLARVGFQKRGDSGSAARFFYCAKASRTDRNEGLEAGSRNRHPTVKPVSLMRYLCRLITPPGGLIADPFMGSGSTGKAAMLEGFRFLGIEQDADDIEIARARIAHAARQPKQKEIA